MSKVATPPETTTPTNGKQSAIPLSSMSNAELIREIRDYWNSHIHDLAVAKHPVGTKGFFDDLDEYRFDKLRYLPNLVDFNGFRGKKLLEVGCGAGIDLIRFARGGAIVTGVDVAEQSVNLAKKNFELNGLKADLQIMNAESLDFGDNSFDVVYGHGVIQYTADHHQLVRECVRVLKPGGVGIFMVYNRISWLNAMSKVMKVSLEHEDAPVLKRFSIGEFKNMLARFSSVRIVPERFPVHSRLHRGWKGFLYNSLFVPGFNLLPRALVRPLGWHLMAFCKKQR
jgi:2-polyprenyl-3-methyl-5-hydroxy-6-metoxy-1,4-benzoquinol methylase